MEDIYRPIINKLDDLYESLHYRQPYGVGTEKTVFGSFEDKFTEFNENNGIQKNKINFFKHVISEVNKIEFELNEIQSATNIKAFSPFQLVKKIRYRAEGLLLKEQELEKVKKNQTQISEEKLLSAEFERKEKEVLYKNAITVSNDLRNEETYENKTSGFKFKGKGKNQFNKTHLCALIYSLWKTNVIYKNGKIANQDELIELFATMLNEDLSEFHHLIKQYRNSHKVNIDNSTFFKVLENLFLDGVSADK